MSTKNDSITCQFDANPDITGLGVVIPSLLNALITMITLIVYWKARDMWTGKIRSSLLQRITSGLLLGLSIQQLITGMALAAAVNKFYDWGSTDPHIILACSLASLAIHTGSASGLIIAGEFSRTRINNIIRWGLCVTLTLYSVFLSIHISAIVSALYKQDNVEHSRQVATTIFALLTALGFIHVLLTVGIGISLFKEGWQRFTKKSALINMTIIPPVFSIMFSIAYFIAVCVLKFAIRYGNCNLNDDTENEITFGQLTAIILMIVPIFTLIDTVFGMSDANTLVYGMLTSGHYKVNQNDDGTNDAVQIGEDPQRRRSHDNDVRDPAESLLS